jgi:hypothetical protein
MYEGSNQVRSVTKTTAKYREWRGNWRISPCYRPLAPEEIPSSFPGAITISVDPNAVSSEGGMGGGPGPSPEGGQGISG